MDVNDYWQENKRFVTAVAVGVIGFLVAHMVVDSVYASDIDSKRRKISSRRSDLAKPAFGASDLADAETQNEALVAAVEELHGATAFRPRPEFQLETATTTATNQYLRQLSRVRDELAQRANRANVQLDPQLGMPSLSPTRDADIERYLEALDVIETVCGYAIDVRVQRVDKILIRGVKDGEDTRVEFTLTGTSNALTRLVARTQRPREGDGGRTLELGQVVVTPSRSKPDEVRLELTVVLVRLAPLETPEGYEEEGEA